MRIRHKSLCDSRIAIGPHAFNVDSLGYLKPEPTPEQWRAFQAAQKYFVVEPDLTTQAAQPAVALEEVFAMPDPEADLDRILAEERAGRHAAALAAGAAGGASEPDATEDAAEGAGEDTAVGFADDVEDLDAAVAGDDDGPYAGMTFEELKAACRHHGIPVVRASRAALVQRLKDHQKSE